MCAWHIGCMSYARLTCYMGVQTELSIGDSDAATNRAAAELTGCYNLHPCCSLILL